MTLTALKKQIISLVQSKNEQEKRAAEMITASDVQHCAKIKEVKQLYEERLAKETRLAAEVMREKIQVQCEYEEKLHLMSEELRAKMLERRDIAQAQLKNQVTDNVEAEKELKQVERLQTEEAAVLIEEHNREMGEYRQKFEQKISELAAAIDRVRTEIVGQQDQYDSDVETKASYLAAIERTQSERQVLARKQRICSEKISDLKTELVARSEQVAGQTAELVERKATNDELQKWRSVMEHRLNDLKTKTEPNVRHITELKDQIGGNETRLRVLKQTRKTDHEKRETMEDEVNELYNALVKGEAHASKLEARIKQFKNRIDSAYTELEPERWASEINKIYNEFVVNDVKAEDDPALLETLDEFGRQKTALSDRVVELRVKVDTDADSTAASRLKEIRKNEELISDLERLRRDNRRLKSDLHVAQTTINALMRQVSRESKNAGERMVRPATTKPGQRASVLLPEPQTVRKTSRSGIALTVEHFG
jgi:chromosome segregation ATPase